jgi:hypothetical protein
MRRVFEFAHMSWPSPMVAASCRIVTSPGQNDGPTGLHLLRLDIFRVDASALVVVESDAVGLARQSSAICGGVEGQDCHGMSLSGTASSSPIGPQP